MLTECRLYYLHLKVEETETQVDLFILAKHLVNSSYKTCREVIHGYRYYKFVT